MLQLLSYVAQTEREFIKQRQAEGIAAAKARGVPFGRPCLAPPAKLDRVIDLYIEGEYSSREASRLLNVSQGKFLSWYHERLDGVAYTQPKPDPKNKKQRK